MELGTTIKSLPASERPREKAYRFGLSELSNVELLAVIIGSGTRGHSAMDIGYQLINQNCGLFNLSKCSYKDFQSVKGISKITALKLGAVFELYGRISLSKNDDENEEINAGYIIKKYFKTLSLKDKEVMGLIVLDNKNKIVSEKILYKGTKHEVYASGREIFKEIICSDGCQFYIFHNHTSDDSSPSDKDVIFTTTILKEANRLGFKLLDHIIISKANAYSFLLGKHLEIPE